MYTPHIRGLAPAGERVGLSGGRRGARHPLQGMRCPGGLKRRVGLAQVPDGRCDERCAFLVGWPHENTARRNSPATKAIASTATCTRTRATSRAAVLTRTPRRAAAPPSAQTL